MHPSHLFTAISIIISLAPTSLSVPVTPTVKSGVFPGEIEPLNFYNKDDMEFIQKMALTTKANGENTPMEEDTFNLLARFYAKGYEVDIVSGPVRKEDLTFPISNCLVSTQGSGGSIGYSGSFSISSSGSISPSLVGPLLSSISLGGSISVGKSLGTSLSYSCSASAGGIAQLQLTPVYINFKYRSKKKYLNPITKDVIHADSTWSEVQSGSMPVLQTPVFHCVNATAAICGIPPTNITLPASF